LNNSLNSVNLQIISRGISGMHPDARQEQTGLLVRALRR
jgi:hypothetical protein